MKLNGKEKEEREKYWTKYGSEEEKEKRMRAIERADRFGDIMVGVFAILLIIGLLVTIICREANAQTRITTSEGWPVVMDGGEWDQMGSTFRLGVKTSWRLNNIWSAGVELQALTPLTAPHPNPQVLVSIMFRVNDKLSFDTGLGYMVVCPYDDKPVRQFVGLGFGPVFPITQEITFGFMTGPGVTFYNGPPIWSWIFLPKFTFLLPF